MTYASPWRDWTPQPYAKLCRVAGKDKETRTDALVRRIKDHPVIAPVIVVGIVVAAIIGFAGQLDDLKQLYGRWTEPPKQSAPPSKPSEPDTIPPRKDDAPRTTPSPAGAATKNRLFAHCEVGTMPSVAPTEGRIHVLLTNELPADLGGGGFADYFTKPGSDWKWANDPLGTFAYRCELTNYSPDVLFNVTMRPRLIFRTADAVPGQSPSARREGQVTLDREWPITVPKIDPSPGAPFVFYIWNCCVQKFVYVRLPEFATTKTARIPLIQSEGNLGQALNPVPFN
jgi:hypothetical protein